MNPTLIGTDRQSAHPNGTPRYYTDKNTEDIIGAAGEISLGHRYSFKIDDAIKPQGDGHVDFRVIINYKGKTREVTIDVKTARKPYNLLVKEWELPHCADILVLAKYNDDGTVDFLGWAGKKDMAKCPVKVFSSLGIRNYYKPCSELRKMSELDEILKGCKQVLPN
jgi:hypothetical protein